MRNFLKLRILLYDLFNMEKDAKIYIAGHRGLVGSAILKNLKARGFHKFVMRTHSELDLSRLGSRSFFL